MARQIKIKCGKCGGTGHFNCYAHIQGGACFDCNGNGYHLTTQSRIDAKAKIAAHRASERAADEAERNTRAERDAALCARSELLGPQRKADCAGHPVACNAWARTLRAIETGEINEDDHPWIFRNASE